MTEAQLEYALRRQQEFRALGRDQRLGELLVEMGLISEAQLAAALRQQRRS